MSYLKSFVFCILSLLCINSAFAGDGITYPTGGTITKGYFTIQASASGDIEFVRFYIHGDDSASGVNKWLNDGFWYYQDDYSYPYGATWNMVGIPNTRYTTMIWIKYKNGEINKEPGGRVSFKAYPNEWRVITEWGGCYPACGNGQQTRTVKCFNADNTELTQNPEKDCYNENVPKPETTQNCYTYCPTYSWEPDYWTSCNAPENCGVGSQELIYKCVDDNNNKVSSSYCSGTPQSKTKSCNEDSGCIYEWKYGSWGNCSETCGSGTKTRNAYCRDQFGNTVSNYNCQGTSLTTETCTETYGCKQPVATIDSISPPSAKILETVSFSGYGNDPDGGSISAYEWRSSIDGQLSTQSSFSTSNLSTGNHTIYFKVQDDEGIWSTSVEYEITILQEQCPYPEAALTTNIQTGELPLEVQFTDQSVATQNKSIISWEWNFGDGSKSFEQNPVHIYNIAGTYTVTLKVKNNCGEQDIVTKTNLVVVKETSKDINLAVPFIAQSPPGDWDNTRNCGPTSYLMIYTYYKNTIPTVQDIKNLDDWLFENEDLPINNYNGSYTTCDILKRLSINHGGFSETEVHRNWTMEGLVDELQKGYPVIVAVRLRMSSEVTTSNGHFMVLRGIDQNYVYVNDPGRSLGSGKNKRYSKQEFLASWNTQGRACVTLHSELSGGGSSDQPLNLVSELAQNKIVLGWDHPDSELPLSYQILRNGNYIDSVESNNTYYTDTSVEAGVLYCYTVKSEFEDNLSGSSNEICIELSKNSDEIDLEKGLVAYYPFNGDVNDESGNGNHGEVYGASLTEDSFGNKDSAFLFENPTDSSTNRIILSDGKGFNKGSDFKKLTISLWFQAFEQTDCSYIFRLQSTDGHSHLSYSVDNKIKFTQHFKDFTSKYISYQTESNKWIHAVATWNGSVMKFYINSEFVGEEEASLTLHNSEYGNSIGANPFQNGLCSFNGKVDDIRIYNRAINEEEIKKLYGMKAIDLENGLVAFYPFNGNANDESENDNHGVVYGASLVKDRFGNDKKAYNFDGINDFIEISDDSSLDLNNMTITTWIKPSNFPNENYSGILCKEGQTKHSSFCTTTTNESLRFSAYFEDGTYNQPHISGYVDLNKWQFFAYVLENGRIKIYKNDQLVLNNSSSEEKKLNNNDEPLIIGRTNWFPGKLSLNYFEGIIDEVRIYSRAISEIEMKTLYERQSINLRKGLIAYFPFNGNADDESGNGNHGTVNGAVLTNDRSGIKNSAYNFDGNDDYIDIGFPFGELNNQEISWTYSAWIKTKTLTSKQTIIGNSNYEGEYGNAIDLNNNEVRVFKNEEHAVISKAIDQEWHHIIGCYDNNTGTLELFFDGLKIKSVNNSFNDAGGFFRIGSLVHNSNPPDLSIKGHFFYGSIDDIRVYNRAISEIEANALYKNQFDIKISVTPVFKEISSESGIITFEVSSNQKWSATTNVSWLSVEMTEISIIVNYNENEGDARTGKIMITAINATNNSQTVEVRQESGNIDLEEGLVAYFPFNGNANDESGSEIDGKVNGASLTKDRFDNEDNAYFFDGVDDFIEMPYNHVFDLEEYTIQVWVNRQGNGYNSHLEESHDWITIIRKGVLNNYHVDYRSELNKIRNGIYNGSTFQGCNSASVIHQDQWYQIIAMYSKNENGLLKIFINGDLETEIKGIGNPNKNTENLFIGGFKYGNIISQFHGFIDDIRIYNRVLNRSEIKALYEMQPFDLNKGLIAYYPFNGNANDESGNENHGDNQGALLTEDRFGKEKSAYFFDGDDIILASSPFSNINYDQFSVSVWMKTDKNKKSAGIISQYGACTDNDDDNFHITLYNNQNGLLVQTSGAWLPITNINYVADNQWHNIFFNSDKNKLSVYLDGKYIKEIEGNDSTYNDTVPLGIGGFHKNNCIDSPNFFGSIDDIRIYNRFLSELEIKDLFEHQPEKLHIAPSTKEIPPTSGTTTITVNSNVNWNATTTAPWLTIQSNQNTITATYAENQGEIRTAIITVSAEGTSLSPQYIEITQSQRVNNPPEANNQKETTNTNIPIDVSLSATDIDNDPLIFSILQPPSHGTISNEPPNIIYTPDQNYIGTDEFTFKANDGKEDSNIATVSIQINPIITTRHFKEVDGNPADDTWTIYLSSATLDGLDLQPNDEIAIFNNETLVGSFKISEILSNANQLKNYLTAWSTLSDKNGYQAGQPYTFKCWDISQQKEYTCFNPVLTNPYDDAFTGNVFPDGDGKYSIVSLNFLTSIKQTIELSKGYQFVSLNVQPDETEMTEILSSTLNEIDFAKDSKGNMLRKIGPNWVNNIGRWKNTEGYLLRMTNNAILNVEGMPISPETPINLNSGYQFVAYLLTEPIDALTAFSDILEHLDFVKDSYGNMIRKIGPNWVNNIGDLNPGEGFLLKMNADDRLFYEKPVRIQRKSHQIKDTTETILHFGEISGNPADNTWTIYLAQAQINESHLEANDEIAIFDGDKLVGAFQLTEQLTEENQNNHYLTTWATLNDGNGYTAGNTYTFKCWDSNAGVEYSTYELTLLNPYDDGYTDTIFPVDDGNYSIAKIVFSDKQHKTGDMNNDGKIDLKDALWILKTLVGME